MLIADRIATIYICICCLSLVPVLWLMVTCNDVNFCLRHAANNVSSIEQCKDDEITTNARTGLLSFLYLVNAVCIVSVYCSIRMVERRLANNPRQEPFVV